LPLVLEAIAAVELLISMGLPTRVEAPEGKEEGA
jgi:hypothetical protein